MMVGLIFTLLVALIVSFFALQNTQAVDLRVFGYIFNNVPLYVIAIAFMLIGVGTSLVFYLVSSISTAMTIFGKNRKIKSTEGIVEKLQNKIDQLEAEIVSLKGSRKATPLTQSSLAKPNAFQRIRSRLST